MTRKKGCGPFFVLAAALVAACGKKGPPLPPLVKLPQPPASFSASRRASTVDLQFTVPSANTDGTRPANVTRVEVYGFTGAPNLSDQLLLKHGTRIGVVPVKAPRDPNAAVDPEDEEASAEDAELEGTGLDQGAVAHVDESLADAVLKPVILPAQNDDAAVPRESHAQALLGPPPNVPSRTYVSVGISKRGRKGPLSKRVFVPLIPPPPPPAAPTITYDERAISVSWPALAAPAAAAEDIAGALPSRVIGPPPPSFAYNVYEVPPPARGSAGAETPGTLLTKTPTADPTFTDSRVEWDAERCYAVRTVETINDLSVESVASPAACEKLVDTFPPAPPKGLTAVASVGAISLIWQPNDEQDLAGYVVLRGAAPGTNMERITPGIIQEATFKDTVPPGVPYVYFVQAVDKAGNVSKPSASAEEMAR